jgi:hypothetical protein
MQTRAATPALARQLCDRLDTATAIRLLAASSVAWVKSLMLADPDVRHVLLGDTYSFKLIDPITGRTSETMIWWAREVMVAHPDGRSCVLALIPGPDLDHWRMVVKAK